MVMEEKDEEEHCEIPGLNRPVKAGDESWAANLTPGEMILLGNKIRRMLRDTGKATVDRDGWFGPVGAEATVATSSSTTSAGGVDPVGATLFALNGIDPWTITAKLFFSTGRDTFRYSTKTWRCNSWRPGRRQMIERISSSWPTFKVGF